MSWIFGICGDITDEILNKASSYHKETQSFYSGKNLYAAAGGKEGTFHFYKNEVNEKPEGTAVCGTGFEVDNGKYKFLNNNKNWHESLLKSKGKKGLSGIEGHYCGVHWSNNEVRIFTDSGGVFDIYYFESDSLLYFSTDLFLLNAIIDKSELDLDEFASGWLCINKLSDGCIIKNIKRLCKGDCLVYCDSRTSVFKSSENLNNFIQNPSTENPRDIFSRMFHSVFDSGFKISLSFSGGMDSRLLLSLLTSSGVNNFDLHTFGHPDHQDSVIAAKIAKDLNLEHEQFYSEVKSQSECINLISEYVKYTLCINPCSAVMQLNYYPQLYGKNKIILDGGFGEIGRREYMNRLLFINKNLIYNRNAGKIIDFIRLNRADIFSKEVTQKMESDSVQDVENLFTLIPEAKKTGAENWADMFSYLTRLPNFFGPEQKRMNRYVINLMPFSLSSVFNAIINTNVKDRKNGKMYKRIISENNSLLTKYPLVKGNSQYPFSYGTVMSKLYLKYQNFKTGDSQIPSDLNYLDIVKEFALDLLNSESTKSFPFYDYKKISTNVNAYYKGDKSFSSFTDWWLSFEILRRMVYKNL